MVGAYFSYFSLQHLKSNIFSSKNLKITFPDKKILCLVLNFPKTYKKAIFAAG
jgi:hypothetical protein